MKLVVKLSVLTSIMSLLCGVGLTPYCYVIIDQMCSVKFSITVKYNIVSWTSIRYNVIVEYNIAS